MMYLSQLMINIGDNPDRPRPGHTWLRNIYHVHQRLCMGFPSAERLEHDPLFLQPFDPGHFLAGENLDQAGRGPNNRFLFRIDPRPGASPVIVVLSARKPDWGYAFQNARPLLAADPAVREYVPLFVSGHSLRFRILINLSKKSMKHREGWIDEEGRPKCQGKRVALTWNANERPEDVIVPWFSRKGEQHGFAVSECHVVHLGWVGGYRSDKEHLKFRSALLEGRLSVENPEQFGQSLRSGIGSAKAFGFGLLSVAPAGDR